jgi:hypothetical protein
VGVDRRGGREAVKSAIVHGLASGRDVLAVLDALDPYAI